MEAQHIAAVQPDPADGPLLDPAGLILPQSGGLFQIADIRHGHLVHHILSKDPEQAADLIVPLFLGDGVEPAGGGLVDVPRLAPLPAEQGIDGDAQAVRQGGEQLHVRRAALLPLAHRLGGHPRQLAQLLLGEAPGLAQFRDALAQHVCHISTSFRFVVEL